MSHSTDWPLRVHAVWPRSPVRGHSQPAFARPDVPLAIIARAPAQSIPPARIFEAVNLPSAPIVEKELQSPETGAGADEPPPGMFHETAWDPRVQDV